LRQQSGTPAAVFIGKPNNPWFFESFFSLNSAFWIGGPDGRFFRFSFGTKSATIEMQCGRRRQLVNKVVIIVTRLWFRSRRIERKRSKI
jgi:hypothetical protein